MSQVLLQNVEHLAMRLSPNERRQLMQQLQSSLSEGHPGTTPQSFYGRWRGQFPKNFDLDAALRDIRSDWQIEGDK